MRLRSLLARVLALALVSTGAAGAALGVSAAGADGSDPGAPLLGAGDALRVVTTGDGGRVLRSADGRTVHLRGANVNALVDYGGVHRTVPVTSRDGAQARALGFTVVRLAVSWSRIAPQPGVVDEGYLDEIRSASRAFSDEGVRVLLDLHQDRYAAGLGRSGDESDGAPAWAALSGGASTAEGSGGHPYYGTEASRTAAKAFFDDDPVRGRGLQDHYADALARLAGVGEELGPGLAGVELYNEPVDPFGTEPLAADTFSPTRLWPFYRRLIARLRGADGTGPGGGAYDGPIWFEPQATRTMTDDDAVAARFSDDPGLVYGPHVYTDVYNDRLDQGTYGRLAASFDNAEREARRYGAALAPTELPGAQTGGWELHRGEVLRHLDRLGIGGMVWVWKQAAGASDYGWGVLKEDGSVRGDAAIAQDYGRARLRAASAPVASAAWADGTLTVRTTGAGVLDLWDGAVFGTSAPAVGAAPVVSLDGAAPAPGTLTGRRAVAPLQSDAAWTGGRELRLTVPDGEHTVVLRPARAGEPPTPAPAAADGTTTTAPAPTTTAPAPTTTTPAPTTTAPAPTTTTPAPTTTTTAPAAPSVPAPSTPAPGLIDGLAGAIGGLVPALTAPVNGLVNAMVDPVRALTSALGGLLGGAPAAAAPASQSRVSRPAPVVASVAARPRRFRSAAGTTVSVSAPAARRVRVVLERRAAGRRRGSRCVAASRRLVRATPCVRWRTAATVTRAVGSGRTAIRVPGRSGRRTLPAGGYRAAVTPLAADGRTGRPRHVSLTVIAPGR